MGSRRILLIVLAIFVVIALAVGGWLLRTRLGGRLGGGGGGTVATGLPDQDPCHGITDSAALTACLEKGYYSWARQQIKAAVSANDPARCAVIPEAVERDACAVAVVRESGKIDDCGTLQSDEAKEGCISVIASAGNDFTACQQLTADDLREGCESQVVYNNIAQGIAYCDQFDSRLKTICQDRFHLVVATTNTDYRACQKISTPDGAAKCRSLLPPDTDGDNLSDYSERTAHKTDPAKPDTDGDELTDYDEVKVYQTNPRKTDTDSDGFTDGQEVNGGYNPKGPGKLDR